MKFKTMRMTKECKICRMNFTYRKESKLIYGDKHGHVCGICKKNIKGKK